MNLTIKDVIGSRCIVMEDGQKIYDLIHESLINGETVTIDFKNVFQFASPFFNYAIGQLLKDIPEADLHQLLKFEHLNETGQYVVDRVIENAAQYHCMPDYSKIVDDMLAKLASGVL